MNFWFMLFDLIIEITLPQHTPIQNHIPKHGRIIVAEGYCFSGSSPTQYISPLAKWRNKAD